MLKDTVLTKELRILTKSRFSYPIPSQIILGIICLTLNVLTTVVSQAPYNPLFLDTIFIVTASFFGWISGLITSGLTNLFAMIILKVDLSSAWFSLCSISYVIIVRLYVQKKAKINWLDLLPIYLIAVLVISVEGAIISTLLYQNTEFREFTGIRFFTVILIRQHIPIILSSLLSRIPINILDKAITTLLGYLIYLGADKFLKNRINKNPAE
ncbi:MAG: hypothetical protein J6V57_03600 [Spirochaetaceae bacterium]|nr:hypothetical protein [Spirochaetaceae bacterium]